MDFERKVHQIFFQWFFWTILIALTLDGLPWKFPSRGQYGLNTIRMTLKEGSRNSTHLK